MLTIGYLGNGKSVNRYHLPYVKQRGKLRVKTIYRRHPEHDRWEKLPGTAYTTELSAVLNDPEIELVCVCTPPDSHFALAKEALLHGKHVLVEKPFTVTAAEARELFALAGERGLVCQCYQNRRYDSDYLTASAMIKSGRLGEIFELESRFAYWRPETLEAMALREEPVPDWKSFYYGHGSHLLDQAIALFGRADREVFDVRRLCGPRDMLDYFDVDLFYGAAKVSIRCSYLVKCPVNRFTVYGRKGTFVKRGIDRQEEYLKRFQGPETPGFGEDRPEDYGVFYTADSAGNSVEEAIPTVSGDYGRIYDGILASIRDGAPKPVKDEETVYLIELLEKGSRAAQSAGEACGSGTAVAVSAAGSIPG